MKAICASILVLITAVVAAAQAPDKRPFLMPVEDVFVISGRGVVVTGRVERGILKVGDTVEIVGINATKTVTVAGVEMFRKMLDEGKAGDNVGVLLRGVQKGDVVRGQVLAKPGSVKAYTKFKAIVDLLPTDKGGRATPVTSTFRPMIDARIQTLSGSVVMPKGRTSIAPGEKGVEVEITVTEPAVLEKGQMITIREGKKTIGSGIVTTMIE